MVFFAQTYSPNLFKIISGPFFLTGASILASFICGGALRVVLTEQLSKPPSLRNTLPVFTSFVGLVIATAMATGSLFIFVGLGPEFTYGFSFIGAATLGYAVWTRFVRRLLT
jgi:hypothetical protein